MKTQGNDTAMPSGGGAVKTFIDLNLGDKVYLIAPKAGVLTRSDKYGKDISRY